MIVLDTTVLVYAKGAEHPLRDPCREVISAVAAGVIQATTTAEAIQEFAHVRSRRRGRHDAAGLANDYLELLSPLLTVASEDLPRGLALFEKLERLGAFDAVLIATAVAARATAIVSADMSFSDIHEIRHVVPDARGVASLLSA